MKLPGIIDMARGEAQFVRYQDGKLWYSVSYDADSSHFEFPVPVDDAGGGEFGPREKGLTLMRWIRKHIEMLKEAQDAQ